MARVWMVRAGRDSSFVGDFLSKQMVAIGWSELGNLSDIHGHEQLVEVFDRAYPEYNARTRGACVGQIYRFLVEIVKDETVVTYDSNSRIYHLGRVTGDYAYHPEFGSELLHTRPVRWETEVSRDALSPITKGSLGALRTIFCLLGDAAEELVVLARNGKPAPAPDSPTTEKEAEDETELREDTEQRALEFLQDRLSALGWEDMQELVAGLLRAMGYKARVSSAGPDRGRDITASPDGFGFQQPRIVAEVKHRKGAMGAQQIRTFLGGLREHDCGLYVSTGGFTKEAKYEAERSNLSLTLMDANELGKAIWDYYDQMDSEARALVPMKKIYWPV